MERVITMSEKELTRIAVMQKLESGSMKQAQAADNLGLTTRQIKRLWKIYKTQGAEGLISKKRGARRPCSPSQGKVSVKSLSPA